MPTKLSPLTLATFLGIILIFGAFVLPQLFSTQKSVSPTLTTGKAGFNNITIQARGTNNKEKIALYINNAPVQFWNLTNSFENYTYTPDGQITINSLSIHFLNDTWIPEQNINYDVQIPFITVNGTTYNSEHQSTVSTGSWDQENWCAPGNKGTQWLNCNGSFTYDIAVGTVVGLPTNNPICGNGQVEQGEQCDDGNIQGGDGCSATCQTESEPPPFSDEFSEDTLTNWTKRHEAEGTVSQYALLDINQTTPGKLTIEPTATPGWYRGFDAPFLYKDVTGNFAVETSVYVQSVVNPGQIPGHNFNSAGLMARNSLTGAGTGPENWIMLNLGRQNSSITNSIGSETKTTRNSNSSLTLNSGEQEGKLLLCRVGNEFYTYHQFSSDPDWVQIAHYTRDDLPETLQVGMIVNGYSSADLKATFDYIKKSVPADESDCTGLTGEESAPRLLFRDDFDEQEDWTSGMLPPGQVAGRSDDGIPEGWFAMNQRPKWAPSTGHADRTEAIEILGSNSDKALGESGKSAVFWRESRNDNVGYVNDKIMAWRSPGGVQQLYVEFYIRFDPNWTTGHQLNNGGKVFRSYSWNDRNDTPFRYFAGGDAGPMAFWNYAGNPQYGLRNFITLRGGPHGLNYVMDPSPVGLPREIVNGALSLNYTTNMSGLADGGGTAKLTDFVNGGFLIDDPDSFIDHEQIFGPPSRGLWTKLAFYMQMNSVPGRADGVFSQWINGQRTFHNEKIPWISEGYEMVPWNIVAIGGNERFSVYDESQRHKEWYAIDNVRIYDGVPESVYDVDDRSGQSN